MKTRGFTLVEMLVTLTLMALVSSLIWQALATAAQLEARLEHTRSLSNDDRLRRAWIEQALAGVMLGADGDPLRFKGEARRLTSYMSMPPWPGSVGPELMTLDLERDAQGQRLMARRRGEGKPLELWRWDGESGAFAYLDEAGNWFETWPPKGSGGAGSLPIAIELRGPATGPVLVRVVATQGPMLRQQDLLPDSPVQ